MHVMYSYEPWYIQRMDLEFQKMGLRGMTVLVASGDDGIGTGDSRPSPGQTARTDCGN
jgi:subtilase family serine protease